MFYKILKDGKVIDVLDRVKFLKYQPKHGVMLFCNELEAQAIMSSDGTKIWHEDALYKIPVDGYETVHKQEIDEYEYRQLKMLNGKTPEEIIDCFVMELLNGGVL